MCLTFCSILCRYVPCNHVDCCSEHEHSTAPDVADNGDASTSIRECCIDSGFRCEKFCICPANCPNRWPGCNCVCASPLHDDTLLYRTSYILLEWANAELHSVRACKLVVNAILTCVDAVCAFPLNL